MAVGDLNGDGILDIVTGNPQIDILGGVPGTTISVLWGNGDGTFRPHVDYQASGPPMFVAVGDLNGDRKNEVAVAVANSSTVTPLLNTGSGPGDVLSVNAQTPSPLTPSVLLMPGATNCTACGVAFEPEQPLRSRQSHLGTELRCPTGPAVAQETAHVAST